MFLKKLLPAFVWALVILALCSMPGHAIPDFHWLQLLSFDKFVHAGIFFVLQLLLMRAFRQQQDHITLQKHSVLLTLPVSILYGALLEIGQYYIFVQRSADIGDFIANSLGAIIAIPLYAPLKRFSLFRL